VNRYQKIAWFNLIVIAATIIVTSIAVAVEFHVRGYSTVGLWFVALLALLKLTPYLFKKSESPGGVVSDERDDFIVKKALLASFISLAVILGVAFVTAFLTLGLTHTVSITMDGLSAVVYYVSVIFVLVLSLAVLVQYGWRASDG